MGHAGEPVFVQVFVAQATVERFDVGVLVRLAQLDQSQRDAPLMRPGQHRASTELLAVVVRMT